MYLQQISFASMTLLRMFHVQLKAGMTLVTLALTKPGSDANLQLWLDLTDLQLQLESQVHWFRQACLHTPESIVEYQQNAPEKRAMRYAIEYLQQKNEAAL